MKNKKKIKFFRISQTFFCFTIHKKLNKSCSLDQNFLLLKKKFVSRKETSFENVPGLVGFQTMLIIDQKNILWIFNNFNSLAFDFLFRFCLSKLWMNSKLVVPSHILSWSKNGMRRLQSGKNWVRKYLHWIQPDIVLGIWQFLSQWFVVNHWRNNKKNIIRSSLK